MALVMVCDRCENDCQTGMLSLSVGVTEGRDSQTLKGSLSPYYRKVDLCGECVKKLTAFIDGKYSDEDWEEKEESESKKEKHETIHKPTCDCIACVQS